MDTTNFCWYKVHILFLPCVYQLSQRSSGWMPTTAKPQTLAFPWSSLPWYGPTHLPPSPSWTTLANWCPTPLTSSYWTREPTPGWPITRWGSCSAAYQGTSRWTPATVWERCRATSHWQVSDGKRPYAKLTVSWLHIYSRDIKVESIYSPFQ